jgi:DNA polymerase-3 subunit alpha
MLGSLIPLLGFRTHFSLGESIMSPSDVVKAAKDMGVPAAAICDTMTVSGMIEFTKKAQKEGVKPIVGVRLRVVDHLTRDKDSNKHTAYIKLFPKNDAGMAQVYALLTKAFDEDHFYEVPRLTWDDLSTLTGENLTVTTGDVDGIFGQRAGSQRLAWLVTYFGEENVFVELTPLNTPFFDRMNAEAILALRKYEAVRPLLTLPGLYTKGGYEAFLYSMAIQKRSVIQKVFTIWAPHNQNSRPHDMRELVTLAGEARARIADRYNGLDQNDVWKRALLNTDAFAATCGYVWTKQPVSLPSMVSDPDAEVAKLCAEGMKKRLFTPVNGYQPTTEQIREVYIPRLKYELGVLRDLKFNDYFLVVSHVVNWSKAQGILVGPGRGSVGGSLIAYLMGITDVDPIRFGLLFERFINPSRNDLPDADLDFMSTRRNEVIAHIEERFGHDKVAGISNYGELGASSAMRDVARIFGKGVEEMGVAKFVPKVHGQPVDLETAAAEVPAIEAWSKANPDIWRNAVALEGTMRSYGKHAAGVIVSGVPLVQRCVVERREGSPVANWNMAVAEDAGLVKLDILGLSTLDTQARCLAYIWDRHTKRIDLTTIPLDDAKTLELFATGKTMGVFQFEGGAARRLLKDMAKVNPLTFDDLVAANALNRPGPIEAGLVKQYVEAKNGETVISLAHPIMEGALGETFNVLCYQEQVMRISVDLCGFNLSDADKLRKAMGKKDPVLMASFRTQFVDGAHAVNGMDKDMAGELFDVIEGFAGYAFNKSHAVEYSLISYQIAWLKAHYPVEFFAAALSTVDEAKLQPLVEEAGKLGIEIMPPDVNISTNEFVIATDTKLFIPFNRVKGISERTADAIIEGRNASFYEVEEKVPVPGTRRKETVMRRIPCEPGRFASPEEFRARVSARACNVRAVETLDKIGAFVRIQDKALPVMAEERRRDQKELIPGLMSAHVMVNRFINLDHHTIVAVNEIIKDMDTAFPKACNVRPYMGRNSRFVAVFDAPNRFDEGNKQIASSDTFSSVIDALMAAGLDRQDGYWTSLVKRAKEGSQIPNSMMNDYVPYFERELDVLKPPLIVTLGTAAARHLVPDCAKGSIFDYVGKVFYDRRRDCNILIGFTPGMIYHDPDKQIVLNEVFERAASLLI